MNASENMNTHDRHGRQLWLWCPMKTEAKAARKGAPNAKVTCTGIGYEKSLEFGERLAQGEIAEVIKFTKTTKPSKVKVEDISEAGLENARVVIVGFCGGLQVEPGESQADIEPGEVIVASELRGDGETILMEGTDKYVNLLKSHGLKARAAPVHCSKNLVYGKEREELGKTGAEVVEMESWWLINGSADSSFRPDAVIRVVLDSHSLIGGIFKLRQASRVITAVAEALSAGTFESGTSDTGTSDTGTSESGASDTAISESGETDS